jgi:hypothetical protein
MNLYTSFINTILYLPNPFENPSRTLATSLAGGNPAQGQVDFNTLAQTKDLGTLMTCNACHTGSATGKASPIGLGTNLFILPSFLPKTPQPLKNPQLRNIYQKLLNHPTGADIDGFGLDHDGSSTDLTSFFTGSAFVAYTAQQITDIYAYCLQFDTGTAPAVGFTRTLTSVVVNNATSQSEWTLLQNQAALGNIDLVARGTLNGQVHGLLYQPSTATYISDAGTLYTQTQLQTLILGGDTLSIMGVYPGTGSATVPTIVGTPQAASPQGAPKTRGASKVLLAHR